MLLAIVTSVCLSLPAHSHTIDTFRPPPCDRCAGNRGLDLATTPGGAITAGLHGTVTFSGQVGGRLYVVVRSAHDRHLRVTYGGLAEVSVQRGQSVVRGQRVGIAAEVLFVGTRVGERYVDPRTFVDATRSNEPTEARPRAEPRFRITLVPVGRAACDD
jgi:hypothetical protein